MSYQIKSKSNQTNKQIKSNGKAMSYQTNKSNIKQTSIEEFE